ncbi:hypothetical protein ACQPZF_32400 [Actinosynnema sp. CS-041913]|uniref:hypothetical protein n=1 Tax=Actinosynnema sp. CS-041913 TaxID=3239917 RepID=UPI003D946AB1
MEVVVVVGGTVVVSGAGGGVVVVVVTVVGGREVVELVGAVTGSVVTTLGTVVDVLEVADGLLVIHVDAGGSAFCPSSMPSMYTPISTPVSADAATARPLAAQSTRTADLRHLFVGVFSLLAQTVRRQNSTA